MRQGGGLALFLSQQEPKEACALSLALAGRAPGFLLGTLEHTPGLWVWRLSHYSEGQGRPCHLQSVSKATPRAVGNPRPYLGIAKGSVGCWSSGLKEVGKGGESGQDMR